MATGNPPHRHHYVPRMVLRNFINEDGGIYFWRRGAATGDVQSTTPANLFVEQNLYTRVGEDGTRDQSAELWFGRLESLAAPFIQQLLDIVRSGMTPIMSREALDFWHVYNYHAQKRTVAWHSRFLTNDDLLSVAKTIASEEEWTDHLRAWEQNPADAVREMNNARIASQIDPLPDDLLAELRNQGLVIYVAPPRTSFILGDEMSATARISAPGLGARGYKIHFMPIAPDVAVGYSAAKGAVQIDHLESADVRRMNEATAKRSHLIAGRSEALVRSLSRIPYAPPADWTDVLQQLRDAG